MTWRVESSSPGWNDVTCRAPPGKKPVLRGEKCCYHVPHQVSGETRSGYEHWMERQRSFGGVHWRDVWSTLGSLVWMRVMLRTNHTEHTEGPVHDTKCLSIVFFFMYTIPDGFLHSHCCTCTTKKDWGWWMSGSSGPQRRECRNPSGCESRH